MISLDEHSKTPLYEQIYEQFKNAIESGKLAVGTKLPATRILARDLCIGRNTVENAYQQLYVEGYVNSKVGSGYFVMNIAEEMFQSQQTTPKNIRKYFQVSPPDEEKAPARDPLPPVRYDFHYKNMDSELFPYDLWRKYTSQLLAQQSNKQFTSYSDKQGEYNLRAEILKYLYKLRGVECGVDQLVICCGLQFALEKICTLMPREYHHVGFEEPGYDSARLVFEKKNFTITPVPVVPCTEQPFPIDILEAKKVKTLFLTPSHQFPTGHILPISARYKILKWAQDNDCYIIEDDYDGEYRYNSKPIPALQSIDSDDRVIYLGSFSKVLSPSLRISYLVLPKHLVPIYHQAYLGLHPTTSWLQQETLALYMKDGQLEKHMRKTFQIYKERHNLILQAINEHMDGQVQTIGQNAGLHVMLKVNGATSQEDLVHRARLKGVKVYPTTPYWIVKENCPPDTVMIGYAQVGGQDIDAGIRALKEAWFGEVSTAK